MFTLKKTFNNRDDAAQYAKQEIDISEWNISNIEQPSL